MTNPDFAELKEKLVKFDNKDEGAFRYYADMCSEEIMDSYKAFQEGAYYQNSMQKETIKELLEIIQSQSEAMETYHDNHYAPKLDECLSKTTTRLQKLREK